MTRMMLAALGLSAVMAMTGVRADAQAQRPGPAQGGASAYPKNDYSNKANWLCWPGKTGDACSVDLTTTVIRADGTETVEKFTPNPKAPIDCFYVYPTVSNDPGAVSTMNIGPEELNVVKAQLARFGSKCRIYAPMYRQFTLTALRANIAGQAVPGATDPAARQVGYNDVLDAWNYYLANENHGRGYVLIGHSQGSGVLTRLISAEIDGKPVGDRMVSALLMGTALPIDKGSETGRFKAIPQCKSNFQTGCVIAYSSFRDTIPPPPNSRFGKGPRDNPNQVAACENAAALGGGPAELHAYLSNSPPISGAAMPKTVWVKDKPNPTTPFISVPGLLTGACVSKNGFNYLEVHVNANPKSPRTQTIEGDVVANGKISEDWGLHLIDANLEMGNLVDVVGSESKAYLAKAK